VTERRPPSRTHDVPAWLPFAAGGPPDALEALPPSAWADALATAERGGVLAALAARLRATGAMALLPRELQERLEDVERRTAVSVLSNQRAFVQIARSLATAGVPVVPYKGIDLAHTLYPEAGMRPMSDVDLWVRSAQVPAALAALAQEGLVEKPSSNRVARYPRAWDGEIQLRRTDGHPTGAELHMGPFPGEWLHRAARIDRAGVWERLRPGELLGQPIHRLAPEDHALEVALHAAITHQLSLTPLRQLLDLVMLGRTRPGRGNLGAPGGGVARGAGRRPGVHPGRGLLPRRGPIEGRRAASALAPRRPGRQPGVFPTRWRSSGANG
jgi:hypothetical protein